MLWTIEQFLNARFDLPEGGRWCEVHAGEIQQYHPPDPLHGNVILNLSKKFAEYQQSANWSGAACFELGIVTSRNPDTILSPAVSLFRDVGPFELSDEVLTKKTPQLVVEVASTRDRKQTLSGKLHQYHQQGVEVVWIIDTSSKSILSHHTLKGEEHRYSAEDTLACEQLLPGLELRVGDLFKDPSWWK